MRSILLLVLVASAAFAQNDSGSDPVKPLLHWTFDGGEPSLPPTLVTAAGPRPPQFPTFAAINTAAHFTGKGITIRESQLPNLQFTNGDAITLEAWVKVDSLNDGAYAYLVGKGRTKGNSKNQTFALRLHGEKGTSKISFLFASERDWHRWTSTSGFNADGWHHVAVSYRFGEPKSIRGVIDGKRVEGAWDMGGATTKPPVNDADDVQLGTGNGGGASNSFLGMLDSVMIWRAIVPEATLLARYQRTPPAPALSTNQIPRDHVLVQLCHDGMPTTNAWPDEPLKASETLRETHFGFFELPHRYIDDGVRADRPNPLLLRAASVVKLPPGTHRILLRGRGAARLYIDDQLRLSTPFPPTDSSGHGSVRTLESYLNLGPEFRFAPPGNRETWQSFTAKGEHRIVLETIVGNYLGKTNRRRPELGETVVAISLAGSDAWHLLTPTNRRVPYTDAGWHEYASERSAHYATVNAAARAARRNDHSTFWASRRTAANEWLKQTPEIPVPSGVRSTPTITPIDAFLAKAIDDAIISKAAAKNTTVDYFRHVQPILETKCYGCHVGENAKGDLRLDLPGNTAIVANKPNESELMKRVKSHDADRMPPKGDALSAEQIRTLETWIREGAIWPKLDVSHTTITPLADDATFLRRAYLDTLGVVPTLDESQAFLANPSPNKRRELIDRLLADPRWADHWMSYWQDVLAENPNLINPTLNNTGPFRWWLLEALQDNLPMDRFVTQLLRMRGSERYGGPAGFAVASQNDSPFAAKGTIVAAAFLGVEMKCARCHDAPAHRSKQEDLFQLAAMLNQKPLKLPTTSSVPLDKLHEGGRKALISVTLKPGTEIKPVWPFESFVAAEQGSRLAEYPNESRDVLAALITAPQNERFAQVIANRLWQRLMGRGLVEPVDDWEKGQPSHPELLRWLGRELVRNEYDLKKLARIIMQSHAYQRASDATLRETPILFTAPARRRLGAEAIVDSLFVATGKPFDVGEVSLDVDGIREQSSSISLGWAKRSWMLTSTSNERDRPSLSLPRITAVTDVLTAYGWRGARQDPTSKRDHDANVLQPAIVSNGVLGTWLTRLSDDHGFTHLATSASSPSELVDTMFMRVFTRKPTDAERAKFVEYLAYGFDTRLRTPSEKPSVRQPTPFVSWSNHLDPRANEIRIAEEAALRLGPPPTERLDPAWRKRLENITWAMLNSPEFLFRP